MGHLQSLLSTTMWWWWCTIFSSHLTEKFSVLILKKGKKNKFIWIQISWWHINSGIHPKVSPGRQSNSWSYLCGRRSLESFMDASVQQEFLPTQRQYSWRYSDNLWPKVNYWVGAWGYVVTLQCIALWPTLAGSRVVPEVVSIKFAS